MALLPEPFVALPVYKNAITPAPAAPMLWNAEQVAVYDYWVPRVWGKLSQFLEGPIDTPEKILVHAAGYKAWEVKQAEADPAYAAEVRKHAAVQRNSDKEQRKAAYAKYYEACWARKAQIEAASVAWRAAIAQRDAQVKQWNAYIEQLRAAVEVAKAVPVPTPPHANT